MKRYDAARRSMALGMAVMMGVGGITGCGQKETKPAAETTKEVTEVSEQTAAETKTEAPEQAAPEEVVDVYKRQTLSFSCLSLRSRIHSLNVTNPASVLLNLNGFFEYSIPL